MRFVVPLLMLLAINVLADVRYSAPRDRFSDPKYMAGGSHGVVHRFFSGNSRNMYGVSNRYQESWRISGVRRQDLEKSLYFAGHNAAGRLIFRKRDPIGSGRRIFGFRPVRN